MKKKAFMNLVSLFFVLLPAVMLLNGCGNAQKEAGTADQPLPASQVGSDSCTNQCHAFTTDIFGESIAATWQTTTHTVDFGVQCEDCHGGGSLHWGFGPIPYPNPPAAPCNVCHLKNGFDDTRHANANLTPDGSFSQITTTTNLGRHIQECSVCHNPNQRFTFGYQDALVKPSPSNLPDPKVACAACHFGGHQPAVATTTVPQRGNAKVYYPQFRPFTVDPGTGAQLASGTTITLSTFQPNGAVQSNGTVSAGVVAGTNNELHVEQLCAACHAQGLYKNSGGATHQEDIYGEWKDSGHGDRTAAAFGEFSANPTAYGFSDVSHQTRYPYDMALSAVGSTATTTRNAGNNNYACFKCHNGLTSLAYQDSVEGTAAAPVVFGDETVTCVTCHNPHTDVAGQTKNTRKPLVMSKYSSTQATFSGNVFLDNTAVPSTTGNATICVFCHQGRESGYTLFKRRLDDGTTTTGSFLNPHYLGTAAMLWGKNGYEYSQATGTVASGSGLSYGQVTEHQQTNCYGCHMASPVSSPSGTIGGHTWKIISDDQSVVNNATCNTSSCHAGSPITAGNYSDYRLATDTNDYDGDGNAAEGISQEVRGLENQLIALLTVFGIYYNDTAYPYFFSDAGFTTGFSGWTLPTLKAGFNLSFVIKGLPSGATQINQPNPSAATHNYRYNIQLLHDSYEHLYNNYVLVNGVSPTTLNPISVPVPGSSNISVNLVAPSAMARPTGTRAATNYDPQGGGGYDPRQ
jgi:uncharacterized CHY-type Zn-finger protein